MDGHLDYLLIMVDGLRSTWKDAYIGDPNETNEVSHSEAIAAQERWIDRTGAYLLSKLGLARKEPSMLASLSDH